MAVKKQAYDLLVWFRVNSFDAEPTLRVHRFTAEEEDCAVRQHKLSLLNQKYLPNRWVKVELKAKN